MHPKLTHIAMHVQDFDGCIAFYRDICQMKSVHERGQSGSRVVWLAEPGRAHELVLVFIEGGPRHDQAGRDFGHLGFAVDSRAEVDSIAERARRTGCLVWEPREEPYPVGYYCGLRDPDGKMVEISYGQPLGPASQSP